MVKKGDTLIEVTLAIGIFSMIAIAVASVMSGGTSEAQLALETTLAREEIDAQADALRFIHNAYASNREGSSQPLSSLWKEITSHAISANGADMTYNPTSCSNLPYMENGFVIDVRNLTSGTSAYVSYKDKPNRFATATTYPRLIYSTDNNQLLNANWSTSFSRAEGLYVIAVKDPGTMVVGIDEDSTDPDSKSAYFDFYIRTCWYGSGNTEPSSISTEIRLHDPDTTDSNYGAIDYTYEGESSKVKQGPLTIKDYQGCNYGWKFLGWQDKYSKTIFKADEQIINDQVGTRQNYYFAPLCEHTEYKISYDESSPSNPNAQPTVEGPCYQDSGCTIKGEKPTSTGYIFKGWCKGSVSNNYKNCSGAIYQPGRGWQGTDRDQIPTVFQPNNTLYLHAMWQEHNEIITIRADWTSATDYDSKLELSKPGGSGYISANYATQNIPVTYQGSTYSLVTGLGDGRGGYNNSSNTKKYEEFVINTLGGKDYYYSIRRYPDGNVGNDITITVTVKDPNTNAVTKTEKFYSRNRGCTGNYWNVFAFKDGSIVNRNTCSSDMQYGY